jgi:hypothetical protein
MKNNKIADAIRETYNSFSKEEQVEYRFRLLQMASEHFLTEGIPDKWDNMTGEEQDEFLDDHVWEPLEDMGSGQIWEIIENAYEFNLP